MARSPRIFVALALLAAIGVAGGFLVLGRGPAVVSGRCTDFWRGEHAQDCRVRLALEAWARDPAEGRAAIEALPSQVERDIAWLKLVEEQDSCAAYCEPIVDVTLAELCRSRVARPWTHPKGSVCPESEKTLADPPRVGVENTPPEVAGGDIDVVAGDAGIIQANIRAHKGRIETCAQVALMQNPSTAGRIGASFDVSNGAASNVVTTKNTTGSDELAACIVKAVRSMRFDPDFEGHVDEYAWVVSAPTSVPPRDP